MGTVHQVTFEDAWQLVREVEDGAGVRVEIRVVPPQQGKGSFVQPPFVSVTATRREGKAEKARTERCQIGGARGARTVPAAIVRALSVLSTRLEEATEDARQLAAF